MNFKDKLRQLYRLQLSINALTEEVFNKQLSSLGRPQGLSRFKSPQHKLPKSPIAASQSLELSKIVILLQQQNNELAMAIRKNLSQISSFLEPLSEKTLNLLVIAQQHVPNTNTEFISDKCEIESGFRNISKYISQFSELFYETKGMDSDGERLETVSVNEDNLQRRGLKDEIYEGVRIAGERIFQDKLQTDQFLKIVETEIESDKNSLWCLTRILEKVECEKKWMQENRESQKNRTEDNFFIFSNVIEEALTILKSCMKSKKTKIEDLCSVKTDLNRSTQVHSKKTPSFEDLEKKQLSTTATGKILPTSLCSSSRSGFKDFDIFKPFEFDLGDLEASSSVSSKSQNLKPPKPQIKDSLRTQNQVKDLQDLVESLKKNESKNLKEIKRLENMNKSKKKLNFNMKFLGALGKIREELKSVKEFSKEVMKKCFEDVNNKVLAIKKKIFMFSSGLSKRYKYEIEDLNEANECFQEQIGALKEAFQGEVKKMNSEIVELRRVNRELKESLVRINSVCESQNAALDEIKEMMKVESGESFENLKNWVGVQCVFVHKLQEELREDDFGKILSRVRMLMKT